MESDKSFATRVVDASEHVSDELEEEAIARAKNGSDTLLMFLLRARRPAVYREKQMIEVVSPDVQSRLVRQAEAMMQFFRTEFGQPEGSRLAARLAGRLREVWS